MQAQVACATVYGACFVLLDVAVLSFVTGRVRGELGASSAEAQAFATFHQIGFFTAGVLGAYLAQRHGTKRVLLWALLVYTAGSLGCALAPDSTSFVAAR